MFIYQIIISVFRPYWYIILIATFTFFTVARSLMVYFAFNKTATQMIMPIIFSTCVGMMANLLAYVFRWVMVRSFIFQCQAEEAAQSFKLLFNSLPDAVIVLARTEFSYTHQQDDFGFGIDYKKDLNEYNLHYCNRQADQLFASNLSQAKRNDLKASQYLMLQQRCLLRMEDNSISDHATLLHEQE